MSFGKPTLSKKLVRCLNCGETYPENEIELKYAGRLHEDEVNDPSKIGDYWNSKCPFCGAYDRMHEKYVDMTNEKFIEKQHEVARRIHE